MAGLQFFSAAVLMQKNLLVLVLGFFRMQCCLFLHQAWHKQFNCWLLWQVLSARNSDLYLYHSVSVFHSSFISSFLFVSVSPLFSILFLPLPNFLPFSHTFSRLLFLHSSFSFRSKNLTFLLSLALLSFLFYYSCLRRRLSQSLPSVS